MQRQMFSLKTAVQKVMLSSITLSFLVEFEGGIAGEMSNKREGVCCWYLWRKWTLPKQGELREKLRPRVRFEAADCSAETPHRMTLAHEVAMFSCSNFWKYVSTYHAGTNTKQCFFFNIVTTGLVWHAMCTRKNDWLKFSWWKWSLFWITMQILRARYLFHWQLLLYVTSELTKRTSRKQQKWQDDSMFGWWRPHNGESCSLRAVPRAESTE